MTGADADVSMVGVGISGGRMSEIFAEDMKWTPWWWEWAERPDLPEAELPKRTDVVVVGGGYTGLNAALTLARAGRAVVLLEAGYPGDGASSRNGGMVGNRVRLSYTHMVDRFGRDQAKALIAEGRASVDHVEAVVREFGINCHFARMGRYYPTVSQAHYDAQARDLEALQRDAGGTAEMVPRGRQLALLGSERYCGGRLEHDTGGLHPALYHRGLLRAVRDAGVVIAAETPMTGYAGDSDGFRVGTARGAIRARDLVLATNGYTGRPAPYFRRRVIPVASFIIATEPIGRERMARLIPDGRMIADSFNLLHYYRPSPDGERLLFGGRPKIFSADLATCARRLYFEMIEIFPDLAGIRLSHAWTGFVAYTFDRLPHVGRHRDGAHYAMGYCGSGVAMSSWLGHKAALKLLGDPAGATAFDGHALRGAPYYAGTPWFLPLVAMWYRLGDRMRRA